MSWEDPLRKLAASVQHPAPESVASIELSSILEDSDSWYEKRAVVLNMLQEHYMPSGPQDDTIAVLRTFVQKLPKRGQLALMSEILLFKDDAVKLR